VIYFFIIIIIIIIIIATPPINHSNLSILIELLNWCSKGLVPVFNGSWRNTKEQIRNVLVCRCMLKGDNSSEYLSAHDTRKKIRT